LVKNQTLVKFYAIRTIRLWKNSGFRIVLERAVTVLGPLRSLLIRYHTSRNKKIKASHPKENTKFPLVDAAQVAANLQSKGYSTGISLPEESVADICLFAYNTPLIVGNHQPVVITPYHTIPPIKGISNYFYRNPHKSCGSIYEIAHDPVILEVCRQYLNVPNPILYSTNMYWSFPKIGKSGEKRGQGDQKLFHFDVSDSKALSLFFYLTDVAEDSGPHVVIERTNNNRTLFNLLNWKIDDALAEKKYPGKIITITGNKGTGFFEDLLNYHKHSWPSNDRPRLLLMMNYVINRRPLV
jgi:hypothetical protein